MSDRPLLLDGPEDATEVLILAHGAGAGMRHPFMQTIAEHLGARGLRVVRFEFDYMRRATEAGARPGRPDVERVLRATWLEVIEEVRERLGVSNVVIGGKSMGGRIASMVADEAEGAVSALVCLGYPFHPPGRPERLRTAHLEHLRTPALIVQGTRDSFGPRDEVERYALAPSIRLHWLEDGDHSFKPRRASGHTEASHLEAAADAIVAFLRDVRGGS